MHVYFVRHGETEQNRTYRHQSPNTPLSPRGRDMIRNTASVLRGVNPDMLISSEYTRAIESARIIGQQVGLTPITNGLFYEIVRPSSFYHTSIFSFRTIWFALLLLLRKQNPTWQYEDAENVTIISERAKRALAYIESLRGSHQSIVVVSHTVFINIMVAYMCKNSLLSVPDIIKTAIKTKRLKNGGIIHLEYVGNGAQNACNWRLIEEKMDKKSYT